MEVCRILYQSRKRKYRERKEFCRNYNPNLSEFDEIFTVRKVRHIHQQGAAARVSCEIHDLALRHLSLANSCELALSATRDAKSLSRARCCASNLSCSSCSVFADSTASTAKVPSTRAKSARTSVLIAAAAFDTCFSAFAFRLVALSSPSRSFSR